MKVRVAHLEEDVREIKVILRSIEAGIAALTGRVQHLTGRVENLPSTWQMITIMFGGQITLAGLLYTALRLGSH